MNVSEQPAMLPPRSKTAIAIKTTHQSLTYFYSGGWFLGGPTVEPLKKEPQWERQRQFQEGMDHQVHALQQLGVHAYMGAQHVPPCMHPMVQRQQRAL